MGMLGRACGAQGTSAGADANGCTVGTPPLKPPPSLPPCPVSAGWLMDGHVKTSAVPRACIHDIHVHIQNKKVNPLLPLLLVCAV
jgi:hypothetical protein